MTECGIEGNIKKIIDSRTIWLLFGLCWAVYFISYIGRMNYSAAMPDIISSGWLTITQAGSLSTVFFICYAGGQFINGFLGDRIKPENLVFAGLSLSAVANMLIPFAPGYAFALLFWAINGYVLSMLWPPIIRIFADMLDERTMVKCGIHITSSMAAGSLCAYLLASVMIRLLGWRAMFFAASVLLFITSIVWRLVFARIKKRREKYGVTYTLAASEPEKDSKPASSQSGFIRYLLGSGIFVLLLPVAIHGAIKDGVTAWIPTMLAQTFTVPAYTAVLAVSILPIFNLSGAYMAGFVLKRWIKNEILCAAFFFLTALMGIAGIILAGSINILLTVVFFSVITASILAVNVLMINLVPLRFHLMGRTATVSGMFNAAAYVGSATAAAGIGWIVSGFGWNVVMPCFAVLVIAAGIICVVGGRVKLPKI